MAITIRLRNDVSANWKTYNPTLAIGELGLETDTAKFKFGDGSTQWNELLYASTGGDVAGPVGKLEKNFSELSSTVSDIIINVSDISGNLLSAISDISDLQNEIYNDVSGVLVTIENNYNSLNTANNITHNKVIDVSSAVVELNDIIYGFSADNISAIGLSAEVLNLQTSNFYNTQRLTELSGNINSIDDYVNTNIPNISNALTNLISTNEAEHRQLDSKINNALAKIDEVSASDLTKADKDHIHEISAITSLSAILDEKLDKTSYNTDIEDINRVISNIDTRVDTNVINISSKADKEHTHEISDISGLTTQLANTLKLTDNTIENVINIKDISTVDENFSESQFNNKILNIESLPKNYTGEQLSEISSKLEIYTDGFIYSKNNNSSYYSLEPNHDNSIVIKSDISQLDNTVRGSNITITHPNFDESDNADATWNITTTANNGENYQVYFRQDINDISSETSSYSTSTRLVSDTEVYGVTDRLKLDIQALDSRIDVTLTNLERWDELSADVNFTMLDSDNTTNDKTFSYIVMPLENVIDDTYNFESECYKVEAISITTASNLAAANPRFNYYDYYAKSVCATVYAGVKTRLSETSEEFITLVKLAQSSNSFVLKESTTYTFVFSNAISKIKGNTLYFSFEMVHSNERIDFPVNKIVSLNNASYFGLCLDPENIEDINHNLSVPSFAVHGSILKDITGILVDYVNDISAKLDNTVSTAIDNLNDTLEAVSGEVYNYLTTEVSNINEDITSLSGESVLLKDITLTGVSNVGALTNGDKILAGTTLTDILSRMLQVEQLPKIVLPSIKRGNTKDNLTIYKKIGTELSSIGSLIATYTDGTYDNDPTTTTNPILKANAPVSAYVISYEILDGSRYTTINETIATTATSYVLPYTKSDIDYLPDETLTYTIKCYYDNGDTIISNTGVQHPTGTDVSSKWMVVAGSTNTLRVDIIGYRPYYYGVLNSQIVSNEISSDEAVTNLLSKLEESEKSISNGNSFNIDIDTNTMAVVFAYDASLNEVSQVKNNGNNLDITEKFKEDKSLFDKKVYGENNQYPIKYNIYYMNYNTKPTSDTTYTITI